MNGTQHFPKGHEMSHRVSRLVATTATAAVLIAVPATAFAGTAAAEGPLPLDTYVAEQAPAQVENADFVRGFRNPFTYINPFTYGFRYLLPRGVFGSVF